MKSVNEAGAADALAKSCTKIKVLQVVSHLELGGAEGVALQLATGLRDCVDPIVFAVKRAKHVTDVGRAMRQKLESINAKQIEGSSIGFKKGGCIIAALKLISAIKTHKPDIIHLHTEVPELTFTIASLISPSLRRIPLVRTIHNSRLWQDWESIGIIVTNKLSYGTPIAVSQSAADANCKLLKSSITSRSRVILNSVIGPKNVKAAKERRSRVKILFAARFVHQKGADLIPKILSLSSSMSRTQDVDITIAGEGPLEEHIRSGLDKITTKWKFKIRGPIADLAEKLAEFDCILMPSRFEGLPLLHLEALIAGVPIITFRCPGVDEILPKTYPGTSDVEDVAAMATALSNCLDDIYLRTLDVSFYSEIIRRDYASSAMCEEYYKTYLSCI